nr:STAS domain-containing protein [Anaerolineae bacterium]
MEITTTQQGNVTVIHITGNVDAFTAGDVTSYLKREVDSGNVLLIVDLADVGYMSSAGLRTMLMILKQVRQFEGDLRLASPQEPVQKVLSMAGLTSIMEIFDDLETAVSSYEG